MTSFTIFVSSRDDYADCWLPFFTLLKKSWPGCNLPIVLNTQVKDFSFEGLDISCTKTGKFKHFGETFHAGLAQVKTDRILLIMIDYFLTAPVQEQHFEYACKAFMEENLDGLVLVEMKIIDQFKVLRPDINLVTGPGPDRFTFQIGLWKKSSLGKYILRREDPWMAEKFGSRRWNYSDDRIGFVNDTIAPFTYLHTGAQHKGGWVPAIIPFLEREGLGVDWSKRGLYQEKTPTLGKRIAKRRSTAVEELWSRLHLLALRFRLLRAR
jgi:hypothetical protein